MEFSYRQVGALKARWDRLLTEPSASDSDSNQSNSSLTAWAESFIFAGSSALLLLIANLFTQYWYLSFFALIPFLYRLIKATPIESLRLGFLLGLSFFGASAEDSLGSLSLIPLLKLISGITLFALYGWSVGWARNRWGFSPSMVALLWVGLELALVRFGLAGGIFGEVGFSHPLLHGLVSLFGFLTISAIIVLLNSLLVLAIVKTLRVVRPKVKTIVEKEKTWEFSFTRNLFAKKIYLVPEERAPPFSFRRLMKKI
jgi:apolipoprotein N-acyltransferase